MRQAALFAVLIALGFSVALGISKSYDVTPYGNCVAEIVIVPNGGVTQFLRNTLDSLITASVWVGDTLSSQPYKVEIDDSATGQRVAYNNGFHAPQCWAWLNIPVSPYLGRKPVRGRTYKVVVSRSGGGAISFAYDTTNPIAV